MCHFCNNQPILGYLLSLSSRPLKAATRRAVPAASLSVCWKRERGRKEVLLCCLTPPDLHREGAVGLSGAARQEKRAGGREGSSSPPVRQQPRDTGGDRAAPAVTIGQNSDNISHHPLPTHPLITKLSTTFLSQLSLLAAPSWPGSLAQPPSHNCLKLMIGRSQSGEQRLLRIPIGQRERMGQITFILFQKHQSWITWKYTIYEIQCSNLRITEFPFTKLQLPAKPDNKSKNRN